MKNFAFTKAVATLMLLSSLMFTSCIDSPSPKGDDEEEPIPPKTKPITSSFNAILGDDEEEPIPPKPIAPPDSTDSTSSNDN